MILDKKVAVIIAAAGSGHRMGGGVLKQYIKIDQIPMAMKAAGIFLVCKEIDYVIYVAEPSASVVADDFGQSKEKVIIAHGASRRQDSVYNGLLKVPVDAEIVLIHDGARPFVSEQIIKNVLEGVIAHGAAIPCVAPKATIRTEEKTLNREDLYEVQTPQGFLKAVLLRAFERAIADNIEATDEASLVERLGVKIALVPGQYGNVKVTTREDLPLQYRTGFGYDVHRLVPERELWLGCVKIPYEKGLLGHSDADVIVHAIADALLGAAALGDIGKHFPDTDMSYKNMAGSRLLELTRDILKASDFTISSIDATLSCEQPKISPYVEEMRLRISQALGLEQSAVSVKATTQEGLGFSGRQEGMSAFAVATIR
ncbi:MAG: 2-C-methyl-D-erythritol 2,4-cyclodiphosphate synthase [Clostridia bacterium]|nr:2-C-methyl-D-erythritol 2,4-cyclodiphosphate synthase [Clostridia bacterium]